MMPATPHTERQRRYAPPPPVIDFRFTDNIRAAADAATAAPRHAA